MVAVATLDMLDRYQGFYFEASLATYVNGEAEKRTIHDLPGSKSYRYEQGSLLFVDTYVTNGEHSCGNIYMWDREAWENKPFWYMQYGGWCKDDDPEVIACLKAALREAFVPRQFHGGRGPADYRVEGLRAKHGLTYINNGGIRSPDCLGFGFRQFQGRESICRPPDWKAELFWHEYRGGLLVPAEDFSGD